MSTQYSPGKAHSGGTAASAQFARTALCTLLLAAAPAIQVAAAEVAQDGRISNERVPGDRVAGDHNSGDGAPGNRLSGDQALGGMPIAIAPPQLDFALTTAPVDWKTTRLAGATPALEWSLGTPLYSSVDFRPRGRSLLEVPAEPASGVDAPMLKSTTVWQRLSDYRSHDRVRLLTLWETGGSSLSLQTNRKGSPSLQWTSRLMNRGGATRGLLDHFVAMSMAGANRSLHAPSRAASEPVPQKASAPGSPVK